MKEKVLIDRYNVSISPHNHLINSSEIRELLEGLKGMTDTIIDSPSIDLSHLNREVEFDGKEYNIVVC